MSETPEKYPYKRTVRIPGTKVDVHVVSDEECEKVDCVICVPFVEAVGSDTIPQMESYCMDCGVQVARDARGPKKPPSLCWRCMLKRPKPDEHTSSE